MTLRPVLESVIDSTTKIYAQQGYDKIINYRWLTAMKDENAESTRLVPIPSSKIAIGPLPVMPVPIVFFVPHAPVFVSMPVIMPCQDTTPRLGPVRLKGKDGQPEATPSCPLLLLAMPTSPFVNSWRNTACSEYTRTDVSK